ncbi:MAG: hypothetical protein IKW31_06300 [Alistipes sp.]|nr:hypothetical protein [Alistipes sp.]
MRKLFTYISASIALLMVASCTNDTTKIDGFEADTTSIEALASGGEYSIVIRSDREWTAQADVPWLMVSPANGRGEVRCKVRIDSTLVNDARNTKIRFMSEGFIMQEVDVNQEGYARAITPDKGEVEIAASATRDARHFDIDISTNVEFDVEAEYEGEEGWLTVDDYTLTLDRGARPRTTTLGIAWKMNHAPEERVAILHLKARNGEALDSPATIVVRQTAAPLIEDNRQGDSLAVVAIFNKLECWSEGAISTTEGMHRWECVRLWEATDATLPAKEAVGRVRDIELSYFDTYEGIPYEIKYLKYLETISLFGNVNTMLKSIDLGEEICTLEYLKALRVAAFGLSSIPESFKNLGDTLEELDLNSNNFDGIPAVLTEENFPHLKTLDLTANRRNILSDLRKAAEGDKIGMHHNTAKDDALERLLLWENLEELSLSYDYFEGAIPDFKVGEKGVRAYTDEDFVERGDTLAWAVQRGLPRVLPNMRSLRLNLNFLSGELPEWLLYHPRLMEWSPENLIYIQQEGGVDSNGNRVGFSNEPTSREYYFQAYPLMRGRYEFNDEIEE